MTQVPSPALAHSASVPSHREEGGVALEQASQDTANNDSQTVRRVRAIRGPYHRETGTTVLASAKHQRRYPFHPDIAAASPIPRTRRLT